MSVDDEQRGEQQEREGDEGAAAFGVCYEKAGCQDGDEIAWSVEKNSCIAAGGKSWKGPDGTCHNL